MHGKGLLLAVPFALVVQPARGDHQFTNETLQVLALFDRPPTVHELVRAFGPDPTLALIHVATDPSRDFGVRLRAVNALPKFCSIPCAGTLVHSALRGLVAGPATDGRDVLLMRAALEALGESRSGDSTDVSVIVPVSQPLEPGSPRGGGECVARHVQHAGAFAATRPLRDRDGRTGSRCHLGSLPRARGVCSMTYEKAPESWSGRRCDCGSLDARSVRRKRMVEMRLFNILGLALALVLVSSFAFANGRAPITNGIAFRPGDPQSIFLRTTFGLLISNDDGCTFHWICEQNIGYGGSFDPNYVVTSNGTIFATTFTGLRVSRDGGCNFTTATAELAAGAPGRIADMWVDAIDVGPTGDVWVGTADTAKPNDVYRSTDNGLTFEARNLTSTSIWWKSLKVAPTDPLRVYVSGYELAGGAPPVVHLFRSSDAGLQWTELPLTGVTTGPTPTLHVLVVAPNDANTILVRSLQANPPNGDRLYRSTDGGTTLTQVLATPDEIRDVVFVDNNQVLVASPTGSYRSMDGGATFAALPGTPQLGCLGRRSDGSLLGCGANWQPDFMALTKTVDAGSWNKVFRFVEMAGVLECPAGSAETDTCGPMWSVMAQQFGTTGPKCGPEAVPDAPPDGGTTKPPSGAGCCDGGAGSASLLWFVVIGSWTMRRRRA